MTAKNVYACEFTIIDPTPRTRKLIIEFKDQNYYGLHVKNALDDTQAIALRDWLIESFPLKNFPIPTPAQKARNADPKTGYTLYLNNVKIWCKTKRQVQSKIGKGKFGAIVQVYSNRTGDIVDDFTPL